LITHKHLRFIKRTTTVDAGTHPSLVFIECKLKQILYQ